MLHAVGRQGAAGAFAYCENMCERLQRAYWFDVTLEGHEMEGCDFSMLTAYAKARLCKFMVKAVYEGRIYDADGRCNVHAIQAYLKSLAEEYVAKGAHIFRFEMTHEERLDHASWKAADEMKSWKFIG